MKITVIGTGAAGNKAAIKLIVQGIVAREQVKLFNTTLKDIPEDYKDLGVRFTTSAVGGCGKDREVGEDAILRALKTDAIDLTSYIDIDTDIVIIATSTEGGSGSGSTPIIAKYYQSANIPVHVFAFIGFNNETKGVRNTISFFKQLPEGITLHTIKNEDYLDYTGNLAKAEAAANQKFVDDVNVLTGAYLLPSEQNIDDTDMYKTVTTPGYMDIKQISLDGVKNLDMFNKIVKEAYDASTAMEYEQNSKRAAVVINASAKTCDNIDHNFEVIKRFIGEPYELFRHVQYDNSNEYMYVIAGGMSMAQSDINKLGDTYKSLISSVDRSTASVSNQFGAIDIDDEDDFKVNRKRQIQKPDVNKLFGGDDVTLSDKIDAITMKKY